MLVEVLLLFFTHLREGVGCILCPCIICTSENSEYVPWIFFMEKSNLQNRVLTSSLFKLFQLLPHLAQKFMRTFSLWDCHFLIERAREATARVAVWRQFNIPMSYTIEASTCGCDQGPYKVRPPSLSCCLVSHQYLLLENSQSYLCW